MPSLNSHQVSQPAKFVSVEIVCVDLYVSASCGVRVIVLYMPPRDIKDDAMCNFYIAAMDHLSNTDLPACIMGDLNLPLIDWKSNSTTDCANQSKFLTYFMSNSFCQVVDFATRDSNVLDIILVDDPSLISGVSFNCSIRF